MAKNRNNASEEKLLTDEEELALGRALSRSSPSQAFTQAEFEAAVKWAQDTRSKQAMLQMVLDGVLNLSFRADGELLFDANRSLTPAQVRAALKR